MYKCIDKVNNEEIRRRSKEGLLNVINEKFIDYNKGQGLKVSCYCIKDTYYLIQRDNTKEDK